MTAACASVEPTSPVITISAGSVNPPANSRSSVRNAAFAGTSGSWAMLVELPLFNWK